MLRAARLLVVFTVILAGCGTVKNAAVTTFRVVDAPARFVRDRIDPEATTTTTTTSTYNAGASDVVTPGRPVIVPSPSPVRRTAARNENPSANPTASPRATRSETSAVQRKPAATATPRPSPAQTAQFPTARPVPGKPGYVYSIDPSGGMVDVTGYKSGDKAKDPYTKQIFIVP